MIQANNSYTQMQQQWYDELAWMDSGRDGNGILSQPQVLTVYDQYYFDRLWRFIPDISNKKVLDFGSGLGRNLVFYTGKVKSIDGVDIAERNLSLTKEWLSFNGFDLDNYKLYKNDGVSLNGVPSTSYDIVMSTICLQHISVHQIRYNLLSEFHRVLNSNGYVTLQFLYNTNKPNTVDYFSNDLTVTGTNGARDCVVKDVSNVIGDLEKIGFTNINYFIDQAFTSDGLPPKDVDDKEWLFITAQKGA